MRSRILRELAGGCLFLLLAATLWAQTYYGAHITAQPPWINRIDVYNNDAVPGTFTLTIRDSQGQLTWQQEYPVVANAVASVVLPADPTYVPAPGEIILEAVEGTCTVSTTSGRIRPKLSFRYGTSLSLCEFFMQETLAWEYVLPNTIQAHFIGTGIAVMNPWGQALTVRLQAFREGAPVGESGSVQIAPHTKLVSISEGIWPRLGVDGFDLVRVSSSQAAFPPPMSITWDQPNDRHVFFNAAATAMVSSPQPGDLVATDPIVGNLVYVPGGAFTQGSPPEEPCRESWAIGSETQFSHALTRHIAVMSTEVTRRMWADLSGVQPSLPPDPTSTDDGSGPDNPVQRSTWYEAVLFANLLSVERGLTPCYYKDDGFTQPITASNYDSGGFFWKPDADGYRLLSEGEWEYSCRAGMGTPFWVAEPAYTSENCDSCAPGAFLNLESSAWFCANQYDPAGDDTTKPVAMKTPNPWGLYDMHGNVWEWCWDWFGAYPPESSTDFRGAETGSSRVGRGGGWHHDARGCRSAYRNDYTPGRRVNSLGFRLARSLP